MYMYMYKILFLYFARYGIIIQKGYQKTGNVVGIVTTKMKGAYEFEDVDKKFMDGCDDYFKSDFLVFDPADYVIPPQVHVIHCTHSPKSLRYSSKI